jgi:hypothetical protein
MSITLGIYDLFSYIIPGMFYLYVFNEFLRSIGLKYFALDIYTQQKQFSDFSLIVILLFLAFIVGQILDPLSQRFFNFFYHLRGQITLPVKALSAIKERHSKLRIEFESKDWDILLALVRQRNTEMAKVLDKFQADSKMLRNIALGLIVWFIVQIILFVSARDLSNLLSALFGILLFYFSISKSNQFHLWFYADLFKASLEYGSSLKEVIEYSQRKTTLETEKIRGNSKRRSVSMKK